MKPPLDHKVHRPNGAWVPSGETNIRRTFRRIRQQQAQQGKVVVAMKRRAA